MSVCIEYNYQKSQLSNISQSLPNCETSHSFFNWKIVGFIKVWHDRSRQRKHLAMLDDRLLKDIGYTRTQAKVEYSKPFWE